MRFSQQDNVRIDITDKDDPDFEHHRKTGEVVGVIEDDVGEVTGDERDSVLYRVKLESGDVVDVRWRDLRPVD